MVVVSISGGKDSTETAFRAIDVVGVERCRFVFADTGNEHALTYEYVSHYLPTVLGVNVDVVRAEFSRQIAAKRVYCETVWPEKGVPEKIVQRALRVLHPTGNPFLDLCLWKGRFPSRMAQFCTQHLKRIPLDRYLLDRIAEASQSKAGAAFGETRVYTGATLLIANESLRGTASCTPSRA